MAAAAGPSADAPRDPVDHPVAQGRFPRRLQVGDFFEARGGQPDKPSTVIWPSFLPGPSEPNLTSYPRRIRVCNSGENLGPALEYKIVCYPGKDHHLGIAMRIAEGCVNLSRESIKYAFLADKSKGERTGKIPTQ